MVRRRFAFGVLIACCVLSLHIQPSYGVFIDLTTIGATAVYDDIVFMQINPDISAGTGVFDSFARIQKNGVEAGFNTDGNLEFDTKSGPFTHSLPLDTIPLIEQDGTSYREFCLDINQNGNQTLSLDIFRIHLSSVSDLTGYQVGNPSAFGTLIYDFDSTEDSWIALDYSLNPGSGRSDMVMLIPDSWFEGAEQYVYLYSEFGGQGGSYAADDGFEEWGVGAGAEPIIPEPATILLLGFGGLLLRRRQAFPKRLGKIVFIYPVSSRKLTTSLKD